MSTITLPNIRVSSDLTVKVRLKDGGVAIDWSTLSGIRALIYSDAQKAMAGRCVVTVDAEDATLLVCQYAANKPQYIGVNRIVISATYLGEMKTYDKPALNFVRWTDDQAGEEITISDPDVEVEIEVEDVSSSILQEAVNAAFSAAERADEAAAAAEHMVDIHTGPAGKSPYIGENGNWWEWDAETEQYVDTGEQAQGDPGVTPDITIGTVTTAEPGTPAAATMTGTPEAPVLNLTIPKGVAGDTPAFTVGEVTTGQPGTPVVVTITGTAAAPVLNVQIPQGMQGNTGSSVDYPYELVNNLTTNDSTKGLSAAQGKVLKDELTQLEQEVDGIPGINFDVTQSITQGTAVSVNTVHAFDEILKSGETYHLKMTGSAASSIALYMKDNSGTNKNCVWNKGASTEATATNKSFTSSVTEYTCTPSVDIYKYAFYVAAANADATGDMVLEITKAGTDGLTQKVQALESETTALDTRISELAGKTYSMVVEYNKTNGRYIKYSDGASTSTGTYFDTLAFPNSGYEKVLVKVGLSDSVAAAIAFYGDSGYISGIQGSSGTKWHEGTVPSGCTRIVVTNRNTTLATPEIYAFNNKVNNDGDTSMGEVFRDSPYLFHFAPDSFMYDGSNGNKLIPGECVGAVEVAARLGFKFIEANVFYTADDEVVVMHGNDGKFGNTVMSLDETDPSDTLISSVTLDYIKTYLRYKSVETKYQEICTLEEFLIACKQNNIGVMLRLGDKAMMEMCVRYLGERRVILSDMGMAFRSYFKGVMAVWNNQNTTTPDKIINTARGTGRPFVYVAGPTLVSALVSAGKYDDLVQQMHEEGFMFGSAYVSEATQQYIMQHGADYIASSSFVNPFDNPNYECFDLDGDASQFTTNGTISGKVATLANGNTLSCGSTSVIPLGKGELRIRFNGSLNIGFGSQGVRSFNSDGETLLVLSDYFLRRKTQLTITATASTTITTLVYMTSKC